MMTTPTWFFLGAVARAGGLASCVALSSCGTTLQAGRPAHVGKNALVISEVRAAACNRSPAGAGATYREELPGSVSDPARARVLDILPPAARRTALAAGLEPLIADVVLARESAGDRPSVESIVLRQQLDAALASLQPQLLAVEFEVECEIALMKKALDERADDSARWTRQITVASLVVGAVAGLVAGAWDVSGTESNGPAIVGVVGAGATTALGVAALVPPKRRIVFVHEHNLLAPIEQGQDPGHIYPTFVFRMMTLPTPAGALAPRDDLMKEWREQIGDAVPAGRRETVESLLWGEGGVYDDDVLALRMRLFEELESTADSFARDIDLLAATLADVLGERPRETSTPIVRP
jgi:hypothetical protein